VLFGMIAAAGSGAPSGGSGGISSRGIEDRCRNGIGKGRGAEGIWIQASVSEPIGHDRAQVAVNHHRGQAQPGLFAVPMGCDDGFAGEIAYSGAYENIG